MITEEIPFPERPEVAARFADRERDVFRRGSERAVLADEATSDEEVERHGLVRLAAAEAVRRPSGAGGVRVTANGPSAKPGVLASPDASAPWP